MSRLLVLLIGPSCSGKTTLLGRMMATYPDVFAVLKSFTSRPRRVGEGDDEYDFVTHEEAARLVGTPDCVQSIQIAGSVYGTLRSDLVGIWEQGKVPVRIVTPDGIDDFDPVVRELGGRVLTVFVSRDVNEMLRRMLERFAVAYAKAENKTDLVGYYGTRVLNMLTEEIAWREKRPYTMYFHPSTLKELDVVAYALYRVAVGGLSLDMAARFAPYFPLE